MKIDSKFKSYTVAIISYTSALLFIYAATSKILDFENFQVQLGQSPLISAFAHWLAIAVPSIEIIIAIGLLIQNYRFWSLVAANALMVMFSVYIYLIVNYSAFVPCSCGGILEEMNWDEHLVFNLLITAAMSLAILLIESTSLKIFYKLIVLLGTSLFAAAFVYGLYQFSENKMKYDNGFVRRFPQHSAQEQQQIELEFNSYYFAGANEGIIYLGNQTAPLTITAIETALQTQRTFKINLIERHLPFRNPRIKVFKTNFYVFEGSIPYIFKGELSNWTASLKINSGNKFSQLEPLDSENIALRFSDAKTAQNVLGIMNLADTTEVKFNYQLLEKQVDGIFDTDGQLHINEGKQQLVYLFLYRNQYVLADKSLKPVARGNTIDTIKKAQIKITKVESHGTNTFSEPPLIVNKSSYVDSEYLYSNSQLRGKYESDYLWKNSSVIDVYSLTDQSYQYSFSINNIDRQKIKSFIVIKDRFYALIGTQMVSYKLIDYKINQ